QVKYIRAVHDSTQKNLTSSKRIDPSYNRACREAEGGRVQPTGRFGRMRVPPQRLHRAETTRHELLTQKAAELGVPNATTGIDHHGKRKESRGVSGFKS